MGAEDAAQAAAPGRTVDAFHRGDFFVVQPAGRGHRSGIDAMVLAAAVPGGFAGRLADLGAGSGAAGLAAISRCPKAETLLVERDPEMAELARQTLALPQNAELTARAAVLQADVSLTGAARAAAGLGDTRFGFVIMNPPFNASHDRATPDPLKRGAHVMEPDLFETWLRTAAAILAPDGGVAVIARPESLDALLAAARGRFGGIEIVPVLPRESEAAIRIVLRGRRGSRKALSIHPPLVLHGAKGNAYTTRAELILNGRVSLFGD